MTESTLVSTFLKDRKSFIDAIQRILFSLEKNQDDRALIDEAFRLVHSLKSEASYLKLTDTAALAHEMEDTLHAVRKGELALSLDVLAGLLDAVDSIEKSDPEVGESMHDAPEIPARPHEAAEPEIPVFSEFEHHLLREARMRGERFYRILCEISPDSPLKYPRAYLIVNNLELIVNVIRVEPPLSEKDASFDRLLIYITTLQPEDKIVSAFSVDEVVKVDLIPLSYESFIPVGSGETVFESDAEEDAASLVVPLSSVDELSNYVDELKIRVHQSFKQSSMREGISEIKGLLSGMEGIVKGMRLVSLDTAFFPLHSLVRDVSGRLGKKARLVLSGSLQVDRGLAALILDILVHVVRNAVDHGIEVPEARSAAGKDETGTIRIEAERENGFLFVRVSDDGCGLEREAVLARARELKLDTGDGTDILSILMAPGFSMREAATEFSGRGVGLDLVRQRLAKMGNSKIAFSSEPGKGTTFSFTFPETYMALKVLMVRRGGATFAFPIRSIEAKLRMDPALVTQDGTGRPLFDGIPVYDLPGEVSSDNARSEYLLVLRYLGRRGCIPVDDFLFEDDIPSEQMTLYMEDNPHVYRVSVDGKDMDFSYVSPSLLG